MTTKRYQDRRKAERLRIPLKIEYRLMPRKRMLIQKLNAQDISGGGLGLRIHYPLKKGTRLRTLLYFPGDTKPVRSTSEVMWCRPVQRGKAYNVGIKHIKIQPADKERFVFLFCDTMIKFFLLPEEVLTA